MHVETAFLCNKVVKVVETFFKLNFLNYFGLYLQLERRG
jgi:hypothetical protein